MVRNLKQRMILLLQRDLRSPLHQEQVSRLQSRLPSNLSSRLINSKLFLLVHSLLFRMFRILLFLLEDTLVCVGASKGEVLNVVEEEALIKEEGSTLMWLAIEVVDSSKMQVSSKGMVDIRTLDCVTTVENPGI